MPAACLVFILIRFGLACRLELPGMAVAVFIVIDFALLYGLIWSYHLQWRQPRFYLKAPTEFIVAPEDRRMSLDAAPDRSVPGSLPRLARFGRVMREAFTLPRLRLASGLILFTFALTHFLNHALGLISLEVMEAGQAWRWQVTRTPLGAALLYGAFLIHIPLGLWRVTRLRTWRMPLAEAAQIALGLSIPVLLTSHIIFTRGAATLYGFSDSYTSELQMLWPGAAAQQTLLLLIVWTHSCIGLHYWLRTRDWYQRTAHLFLAPAVLIPALAIAGFTVGGREAAVTVPTEPGLTDDAYDALGAYASHADVTLVCLGIALAAILAWPIVRALGRPGLAMRYPGGRVVKALPGQTILEASRSAGIPHASVCGGRARCSTCRVAITDGFEQLPEANAIERIVLARIGAPAGVRLACQTRPTAAVTVRPLVPVDEAEELAAAMRDPYRWGIERRVTVMFADLRKFTALSEQHYAYDVVFLLNRYFRLMSNAVERNGGVVDKFIGDAVMAIFGITSADGRGGAQDAILATQDMERALRLLNDEFSAVLKEPIRMGVGLHMGAAILGRVGATAQRGLQTAITALGDTVNIASRLEGATKEFDCLAVMSEEMLEVSGLVIPGAERHEIIVRGRRQPLKVVAIRRFEGLVETRAREPAA